jgi:subtilisin family serine protease
MLNPLAFFYWRTAAATVLLLGAVTTAQDLPRLNEEPPKETSKLSRELRDFLADWRGSPTARSARPVPRGRPVVRDGLADVEVWLQPGMKWEASHYQSEYGVLTVQEALSSSHVWARVPPQELERLSADSGIAYLSNPPVPVAAGHPGPTLTGAANHFHGRNVFGNGVRIAVIDLGYDGWQEAQKAGKLPETLERINFTGTSFEIGSDGERQNHGTAVAEVIHAMAPKAELVLYKIANAHGLKQAVDDCIQRGMRVVNMSLAWFNRSFYDGTGEINRVVDLAASSNILWVNGAGNHAQKHYRGTFVDSDDDGWHNFSGGDETITLSLLAGETLEVYMTWDSWGELLRPHYALYLYNSRGPELELVCSSGARQLPFGNPVESIVCKVEEAGRYHIAVRRTWGSTSQRFVVFVGRGARFTEDEIMEHGTREGSLPDPTTASALSIGSVHVPSWDSGHVAAYSSRGPTNGGLLKPDLCAPSQVDTSVHSAFDGTSAAAPHVAGAAALLLQEDPHLSLRDLRALLEASAISARPGVRDNACGAGRLNLLSPPLRPNIKVTSQVRLLQGPPYSVGQDLTIQFSIANTGRGCVHLADLAAGAFSPDGEIAMFTTHSNVVLCEGTSYQYQGTLTLVTDHQETSFFEPHSAGRLAACWSLSRR